MRAVAMKLHTREQAPKEGKVEAPKQQAVSKQLCCSRSPIPPHICALLALWQCNILRNHPQAVAAPQNQQRCHRSDAACLACDLFVTLGTETPHAHLCKQL